MRASEAQKTVILECKNVQKGWVSILADAEAALRETKAREQALRRSIRAIRAKIERGENFALSIEDAS